MKSIKKFLDGILWLLVGDRPLVKEESKYTYVPDPKPKPLTREQQEAVLLCKAIGVILKEEGEKNKLKVELHIRPLPDKPPNP
ncbi:hypothetical protein KI659_16995 [Litoribacter alkaliphilus]|uniref:Uncharacterized protein n=1 Tax=Litoribacter ruber TaxID=702568 RepID=A0AAP2CL39_9BACT|nr:hypothetical protein [Litoribacter alkaliphilus]MBS9525719.1 hypothetical protein [Litoribacter alkaliphilus]